MDKAEVIIYQPDHKSANIEVHIEKDTVWLNQSQMVELFGRDRSVITKHINNVFKERELIQKSNVHFLHNANSDKPVRYYSLDVIISVGYRVKSKRGTQFRIWANKVLKDYLLKGYAINQRVERLENKIMEHDQKFDLIIKTSLPPNEGIFYDGQIFDAYTFVSDLIKSAKSSIVLIDNYIDESVLMLLSKRKKSATATIYTKEKSKQMMLDLKKHNSQYPEIIIETFTRSHDRFMIIDSKTIYHIGASLKDLGKKWFAFSKININAREILEKIES